jgi:class 3 adenylate cyclase
MKINPERKKVTELRTSSSLSEEESSRNQNTNMTQATVQPQANGENVQRTNSIVKVKLSLAELILSHKYFTWTMTAWTVWALFGDDLRILMTSKPADSFFYVMAILALALFFFELSLNFYARKNWRFGFYFWLDFLATISLLPDIGWIWEPMSAAMFGTEAQEQQDAIAAGKPARAGTKTGRVVRIVRLVRMVRMVKLYKMNGGDDEDFKMQRLKKQTPSKVGEVLSEKITRKVIMLVLVMILALPLIDGLGDSYNQFQDFGLASLHSMASDLNCHGNKGDTNTGNHFFVDETKLYKPMVENYAREAGRLMNLKVHGQFNASTNQWLTDLRWQSKETYDEITKKATAGEGRVAMVYDKQRSWLTKWLDYDYALIMRDVAWIDENLRTAEIGKVSVSGCFNQFSKNGCAAEHEDKIFVADPATIGCVSTAYFNMKPEQQVAAGMNILKTLFVMAALVYGALGFSRDAELLVIGPIERMLDTVQLLAENPLANTADAGFNPLMDEEEQQKKQGYETALLEKTLKKVSSLMQVGFGAAGAEIIGGNMQSSDGKVDPMVDGVLITAVYGFCDIRKFTDTTECLQEEVMTYVNKLGDLVHGCTHSYFGMANKNVGDAFLLSWKICNGLLPGFNNFKDTQHGLSFYEFDEHQRLRAQKRWETALEQDEDWNNKMKRLYQTNASEEEIAALKEEMNALPNKGEIKLARKSAGAGERLRHVSPTEMADSAFTAFLKACVDLYNANAHGNLSVYLKHPRVVKRFGTQFTIKMGFGMHVGWCVQGAIGSGYKIDCTYLSPHCEMADRLEAGSKIFTTPINLSHWMVALMSPTIKKHLRAIDRIKVSGVPVPMTVYTFDIFNYKPGILTPKVKEGRQARVDFFDDEQYSELQDGMDPMFLTKFREGYDYYIRGMWEKAREVFLEVLKMPSANQYKDKNGVTLPDGPTTQLMEYMSEHEFVAGKQWRGVHEMDGY